MGKIYEVPHDFNEEKRLVNSGISRSNLINILKDYPLLRLETPELVLKRMSFYFKKCKDDDTLMHLLAVLAIMAYQEMYSNIVFPDEMSEKAEKLLCTIMTKYADNIVDIASLTTEALSKIVPSGIGMIAMFTRLTSYKNLYMLIDKEAALTINKLFNAILNAPKYQFNRSYDADTADEERRFLLERIIMLFLCNYIFTDSTKDRFYKFHKFLITFDHEEIMVKAIKIGLFNKKNITYAKNFALRSNSLRVMPLLITV